MKKSWPLLAAVCVFRWACDAAAQSSASQDGDIIEQTVCAANADTYEQFLQSFERTYTGEVEAAAQHGIAMQPFARLKAQIPTKEEFERRKAYTGFECRRISYLSDGLKVVGYIWKPKDTNGKRLPLIIYNRGGNREFGKLTPWQQSGFYDFVSNGFVVVASQYRGNDGGEGREEFGGADVADVLNLIPLARSLGYVDMNNVFMLGASRGGMMTYLALKKGAPVNAAAVVGGLVDLKADAASRPEMIKEVYAELMPDFEKRGEEHFRDRSVLEWAKEIDRKSVV